MDKTLPLSILIVIWSLKLHKNPFRYKEHDNEIFDLEISYFNATRVLMYLAQYIRSDIAFVVNLLARFNFEPIRRGWNRIKHIFHYLQRTVDLKLFYLKKITNPGRFSWPSLFSSRSRKFSSKVQTKNVRYPSYFEND